MCVVMDRDRRLTGFLRGQTDNPQAPPGFEVNNPWRVCISRSGLSSLRELVTDHYSIAREAYRLVIGSSIVVHTSVLGWENS